MGILIRLVAIGLILVLPQQGSAVVGPTTAVTVSTPSDVAGDISIPAGREVAELEESYIEEEFFITGEANLYTYNETPAPGVTIVHPNMCTLFTCGAGGGVPYTTRILVRRPADSADFNGTVVIEWLNSTAGFDTSPVWHASAEHFAREGWVYVAVTNSTDSIDYLVGGCLLLGIFEPPECGTRYAALSLPENGVAYEMVSQIANLLKTNASPSPLAPDYVVDRLYHAGQSQQGGSMVTYATAFHFSENDGYFVQAAGSARAINHQTPCEDLGAPAYPACTPTLQGADRRVATDQIVPVYRVHAETDLSFGVLASPDARQTDTPTFRYYETAGTAHITIHKGDEPIIPGGVIPFVNDPIFLQQLCEKEINSLADGPIFGSYLWNAMWENMEQQVQFATAPPSGALFDLDGDEIARDTDGNSIGAIRFPLMDLPKATYGPQNALDPAMPAAFEDLGNLFCILAGTVEPFDDADLELRYPDWVDYVAQYNQKANDLITARFLLPADAANTYLFAETAGQRKCMTGLNGNFAKIAKTQGKEISRCIKDESKGTLDALPLTVEQCLVADRKKKIEKATGKTTTKASLHCTVAPDFGIPDAATVNLDAVAMPNDVAHDIFGPNLDAAIVQSGSSETKCQAGLVKQSLKCVDTTVKGFGKCKKAGVKTAYINHPLGLAECVGDDPKGKIEKACVTNMKSKVLWGCNGVDYAALFPGECAGEASLTAFEACIERQVVCRTCKALNAAEEVDRNCDPVDDGLHNGTCVGE